jgi:glucosamine kinase
MTALPSDPHLAIGIDAGGTQTRWCMMQGGGEMLAEGAVRGLTALMMHTPDGIETMQQSLMSIAATVRLHVGNAPLNVCAGFTGIDGASDALRELIATAFDIDVQWVSLRSDIEVAYFGAFPEDPGYLVYAGTGSIAAFIDDEGVLQRAGGRGVLLDDGGGGFWIAREALRHIWRREDEAPGAWRASPLARALFARIGGEDWALSREFFYTQERGEIGALALAVAETADSDPVSKSILQSAGHELARLVRAMTQRFGERTIAIAGRAFDLHPIILQSMRNELPSTAVIRQTTGKAHHAAARIALNAERVPQSLFEKNK